MEAMSTQNPPDIHIVIHSIRITPNDSVKLSNHLEVSILSPGKKSERGTSRSPEQAHAWIPKKHCAAFSKDTIIVNPFTIVYLLGDGGDRRLMNTKWMLKMSLHFAASTRMVIRASTIQSRAIIAHTLSVSHLGGDR